MNDYLKRYMEHPFSKIRIVAVKKMGEVSYYKKEYPVEGSTQKDVVHYGLPDNGIWFRYPCGWMNTT